MTIDLSPAARLLAHRSWPEARALAEAALAETPRRAEALRVMAAVGEGEGRLDEAHRYLSEAIDAEPGDIGASDDLIRVSHLLGDLHRLGRALLLRLQVTPAAPAFWNDLGVVLERLDDPRQAAACYRRAVAVDPAHAPSLKNGAALAYRLGQFREALRLARRALLTDVAGDVLVIVGHSQQRLDDVAAALGSYRRALALEPGAVSALEGLAALRKLAKADDESLRHIRRTAALAPDSPVALGNLCEALRASAEPGHALRFGRRALVLAPALVVAANALSVALGDLAEDRASTAWARRALHIAPADGDLMINLGIALKAQGLFRQAEGYLRAGLERRPNDANARMALATALLAAGNVREGFAEYESRHGPGFYGALPAPVWDGRPIVEGALLVRGEQGVGDEIMFIQYIRNLEGKAGRIVVECDRRLLSMFRRSFPQVEFVGRSTPADERLGRPDIAAQIALLSLPRVLGFGIEELRSTGAFLIADDSRRREMARRLETLDRGIRVGIAWRSLRRTPVSLRMHTELPDWAPILKVPGVAFVNLQYGNTARELDEVRRRFDADIASFSDLDLMDDLEGALALGSCLDLVISTVTSAYALPAAAGVETWHLRSELGYLGFGEDRYVFCPRSRGYVRAADEGWANAVLRIATDLRQRSSGAAKRPQDEVV